MKNRIKFSHKAVELAALALVVTNVGAFTFGMITLVVNVVKDILS